MDTRALCDCIVYASPCEGLKLFLDFLSVYAASSVALLTLYYLGKIFQSKIMQGTAGKTESNDYSLWVNILVQIS